MNRLGINIVRTLCRFQEKSNKANLLGHPKNFIVDRSLFTQRTIQKVKYRTAVKLNSLLSGNRNTSSDDGGKNRKPNLLMKFEPVLRPEMFLSIKNWILAKFIIQPYLDNDFRLKDFTLGAKQALAVVSTYLSQGDFKSLKGLVADEALLEIKNNFASLNVKERQDLYVKLTDILFAFPFQVGIMFDDSNEKRFAEITVVFHCMNDFEELKNQGKIMSSENARAEVKICNYRFIREYTKGVQSDWTINQLGHFKLCHLEN